MEANKILTADILDIVFEGRNKEYGAYELRRSYGKRLLIAVASMFGLFLLLFIGYLVASNIHTTDNSKAVVVQEVQLEEIKQEKEEPPPPPPPAPPPPPKVEVARFTPPVIVKDEEVKEDEKPPEVEKLEETKIDVFNQEGIKDEGIVAPPVDNGKGVVEAPKRDETDYDQTFTKVEIESSYPGGPAAWARYLNKTLNYPQEAVDNEISGAVVVQFIVDKAGNVTDVEAVSGPNELRAEAVRVIKKSGKWTPAVQNGRQVKSYKKQPIVFRLETQ
ncbi:MAG: TonB family protein [Chitinophagaceae bacterium]|nr:TonB family protein [Chitinophagaceae bacterium]